jgi:hypothetical protein
MHCKTQKMTVGSLWTQKNRVDLDPPYQREAGIWSDEKKQLFMDSMLNGFDVPKLYFHDRTSEKGPFLYSVIDGKQRMTAVWDFMLGNFGLADDFKFTGDDSFFADGNTPTASETYSSFTEAQEEFFRSREIDVVLVQAADEDEIEELFSRLNNGEPLNAAEKRNAMGGDMIQLIRNVGKHPFFEQRLGFSTRRMSYQEVAAKVVRLEMCDKSGHGVFCDLKKKFLDEMVRKNKNMSSAETSGLMAGIDSNLKRLARIFQQSDPLLGKQSYPQLYYGWVKLVTQEYAHPQLEALIGKYLQKFNVLRLQNLQKPEEERDPILVEYGRLMQQGTNDIQSMQDRSRILTRYFLLEHPDVLIKDKKRDFTDDERFVLWMTSGKECTKCGVGLPQLEDMHADHVTAWSHGGETKLSNAQALCAPCNQSKGNKAA